MTANLQILGYQCSASGIKNRLITKPRPPNIPTIGKLVLIDFRIFTHLKMNKRVLV